MVSMSLPHFSEESGSPYFLRKQHHKRVEAGYLFTLTHNRVLLAFRIRGKLLVLVDSEDLRPHIAPREKGPLLVQDTSKTTKIWSRTHFAPSYTPLHYKIKRNNKSHSDCKQREQEYL